MFLGKTGTLLMYHTIIILLHGVSTWIASLIDFPSVYVYIGMCEAEPTPKGWFIKYVDRSPAVLAREQVSKPTIHC